eukprot:gnl/MRDRNA2_/MRDRNA2_201753_c0_seq1.p1 gnl/MRDRNA2_/MRDRNA2_201753_c0~~gnl/MRDRNA2_/MRDRNA2_201753_c0_seq1.p1  ORF type:complete len:359 (-),score=49.21 gnl/MRDRNA2_/MRDRNA2_201753_c0_seq1:513-1493(-)
MSDAEIGCCLSHLRAVKYFIEKTEHDKLLIMEDDVDLSTVNYWNFTWNDLMNRLPSDYDAIQFTVINDLEVFMSLHKRFASDRSAAAYMISRHHAERLYHFFIHGDKFRLDLGKDSKFWEKCDMVPRPVSEEVMLYSGNSYSMPIFLFKLDLGSAIHPDHIENIHRWSHEQIYDFWTTRGSQFTIDQLMAKGSEIVWHRSVKEMMGMLKEAMVNVQAKREEESKQQEAALSTQAKESYSTEKVEDLREAVGEQPGQDGTTTTTISALPLRSQSESHKTFFRTGGGRQVSRGWLVSRGAGRAAVGSFGGRLAGKGSGRSTVGNPVHI